MPSANDLAADLAIRLAGARRGDVDGVIVEALGSLATSAGAPRAYVTLYHEDGTFENVHEWTDGRVVPQQPAIQHLRSDDFAHTYRLVQRGEVFAAHDLMALGAEARAEQTSFAAFGVRAVLQVPIVVEGEGVGLIGFNYWDTVEPWDAHLVETIRLVGQVIGVVLIRERAESSVRRASERAEEAMRSKDAVFAHLSHEFRTPLHAILGFAELLEIEHRSDGDREALFQIQFHGRNLLAMVDDLLALADGTASGQREVEVRTVVDGLIDSLTETGRQRAISLSVSDRLDGVTVRSELPRVRQVMYCVLSGGITALGRGGTITVDLAGPTDGERTIRVALTGSTSPGDDVVLPMARSLIVDHGTIDVGDHGDGRIDIDITFDPAHAAGRIAPSGATTIRR